MAEHIGRYEIKGEIGRGGMATVLHGYDPNFKRDVAIKILPAQFLHDPTFRARFEREARTIAALEHPSIVPVYDFGEEDGRLYLVMRRMTGGSLANRIAENGALSLEECTAVVTAVAQALDKAHARGIVHRDLKPANILFDEEGNAYLSDFGIVKVRESSVQLTGDAMVGTPEYMAPELTKEGGLTGLVDVYALGITLFEMLTGKLPYSTDSMLSTIMAHILEPIPDMRELKPSLSETLQAVVERAMAKDPTQRYRTAGDMANDFARAVLTPEQFATVEIPLPSAGATEVSSADQRAQNRRDSLMEDPPTEPLPPLGRDKTAPFWLPAALFAAGGILGWLAGATFGGAVADMAGWIVGGVVGALIGAFSAASIERLIR